MTNWSTKLRTLSKRVIPFALSAACAHVAAFAKEWASPQVERLRAEAERGDAQAQYQLSVMLLLDGRGPNTKEAEQWLRAAADQGDPRAQNLLGLLSDPVWSRQHGSTAAPNAAQSADLYAQAASQGYEPAKHNLETLLDRGMVDADTAADLRMRLQTASAPLPKPSDVTTTGVPTAQRSLSAQEIFRRLGPAVAEVKSPTSYGSGVIIGYLQTESSRFILQANGKEDAVRLPLVKQTAPLAPPDDDQRFLLIATNEHVVGSAQRVSVGLGLEGENDSALFVPSTQVCVSVVPQEDLAFIAVDVQTIPQKVLQVVTTAPLYTAFEPPKKGSVVFAIGNPEELTRTITQGLYNGLRPEGVQFDAPISVGSSGGALVTDAGELIGLTTGFSANEATQNLNFALPIYRLIQNLQLGQSSCRR